MIEMLNGLNNTRTNAGRFSAMFYHGKNFCIFLFAFLYTKYLLKRVLYEESICSQSFVYGRLFYRKEEKQSDILVSPENVSILQKKAYLGRYERQVRHGHGVDKVSIHYQSNFY